MATKPAPASRPTPVPAAPAPAPEERPLLDQVVDETCARLDGLAERYAQALRVPALGRLKRAVLTADALDQLRRLITPDVMRRVMALMNSPLGFLTDRAPGNKRNLPPYSEEVVKECFLVSLLDNVDPVGNEWNIIVGRYYCTQAGWRHKLAELNGLTDLRLSPGTPLVHQGRMVVRYGVSWSYQDKADRLQDHDGKPGRVIAVKCDLNRPDEVNAVDQILGKAETKALKAVWKQIHGSGHTDLGTDVDEEPEEVPGEIAEELRGGATPAEQEEIQQLLDATGTNLQSMVDSFGVRTLAELTPAMVATARKKLTHRRQEQQTQDRLDQQRTIRGLFAELGMVSDEQEEIFEQRGIIDWTSMTVAQSTELLAWLEEQGQQARQQQEARASG